MSTRTKAPVVIELTGELPSKKNDRVIRRWGNRVGLGNSDAKEAAMAKLAWQATTQWRGREPLEHPRMSFEMRVRHRRKDRDNILTTLLDVLVTAGVLVDDSVMRCNGPVTILPAIVDKTVEEGAVVSIWQRERVVVLRQSD